MPSTIFHHWLDQFRTLPARRRRWLAAGLWIVGLACVFGLGMLAGHALVVVGEQGSMQQLTADKGRLQDRIQGLEQQQQTNLTALTGLKTTLAERDAELEKLRQQQVFYQRLIGIDSKRSSLGIHSISLTAVAGTDAWNFVATLVNTSRKGDPARGELTLEIEGVRDGKLTTLQWSQLAAPTAAQGVSFAFRFFQQVHGSFVLPGNFVPNHLVVTLHPKDGATVMHQVSWADALSVQPDASVP